MAILVAGNLHHDVASLVTGNLKPLSVATLTLLIGNLRAEVADLLGTQLGKRRDRVREYL